MWALARSLPLAYMGFLSKQALQESYVHKTCGMTAPVKQHNTSSDDDTKGNLCSCRYSHRIITLPLASTGNHISNIFSAGLDSQIFGELFPLPSVDACIVLRFWDTRGRGGQLWERNRSAHLSRVPEDQWEIAKVKWHLLSWYSKQQQVPNPLVTLPPARTLTPRASLARVRLQVHASASSSQPGFIRRKTTPSVPQQSPDVKQHICRADDEWVRSFLS